MNDQKSIPIFICSLCQSEYLSIYEEIYYSNYKSYYTWKLPKTITTIKKDNKWIFICLKCNLE